MKEKRSRWTAIPGIVGLLTGCAQPPGKELAMAAARVELARSMEAALFAPELLTEAEAALADAHRLAGDEGAYRAAVRSAALASIRADEAFTEARAERRAVLRQVNRLLREIQSLLEMASARGARQRLDAEWLALRDRYRTLRARSETSDLLTALEQASGLKAELLALEQHFR